MSFQHRSSTQCVPMLLSLQTRKKYDKSPTFKIYTTSACILRSRNIFWTPRAERTTAGLMLLGLFLLHPPSGRGLVITFFSVVFYPAIRTGSSNTVFFSVVFFLVVTCPRPPVFARPKKYSSCLSLHSQALLS